MDLFLSLDIFGGIPHTFRTEHALARGVYNAQFALSFFRR